jgi:branched-chain amino acid aminotransferase
MPSLASPPRAPLPGLEQTNGCFETMRAYGGRIFRLDGHLDRLYGSAAFLGTRAPKRDALARQLLGALKRSGIREAVVRVALLPRRRGAALPSIVVRPINTPTAAQYRKGLRVAIVPARKFSVGSISPQAKYSARLGSVLAVQDAQLRGVDEAVFLDSSGSVTESTASNFGVVSRGVVLTPPYWLGLLAGITREALFEIGALAGIPVREAPLTRHEVYAADEAFMTSTLKEVIGVTEVDGRMIGDGRPGPITKQLHAALKDLVRRELGSPV